MIINNLEALSIFLIVVLLVLFIIFFNAKIIDKLKYNFIVNKNIFFIKYLFLFLSFLIIFVGIFEIKSEKLNKNILTKSSDIVFALDVSKSMNVEDVEINGEYFSRLEASKKIITNYIIKNPNNSYGLIIFAGESISSVPITSDIDVFLTILSGVDFRNLNKQGSDFGEMLKLSKNRFLDDKTSKAIVIFTDGGDEKITIDNSLYTDKINYFVWGIGSKNGGKIPVGFDIFGNELYQKYQNQDVISYLNLENLKYLSNFLKSELYLLDKNGFDNFSKKIDKIQKTNKNLENSNNGDISRFLAFISFFCFLVYLILEFIPKKAIGKK